MEWFQIVEVVGTFVIIPLVGMIWKQNQNIQKTNLNALRIHKKDVDARLTASIADSKDIKENYLNRFELVNNNINGLRNDVTDRLARIETNMSNIPCIQNNTCKIN
jgi:hypothetical protein